MRIALVVAMARNRVIGRDNRLPWHIPEDLRHFKRVTMGKPVVMGRRTFESIGRPLPGRRNIVLTRDRAWHHDGVLTAADLDGALALAAEAGPEAMVIGGEAVFRAALPRAALLYLTEIHRDIEGDTEFPAFDREAWRETARDDRAAAGGQPAFSFVTLERIGAGAAPA